MNISKKSPDITVGEDAYKLLRLYCPFCGKPDRDCCGHRLFVTHLDAFEYVRPEFEAYMKRLYELEDDVEIDEENLVPRALWGRFKSVEEMAVDAAQSLNDDLPDGPACIVIRVLNKRRHDRRTVCFASPLGIEWLKKRPRQE